MEEIKEQEIKEIDDIWEKELKESFSNQINNYQEEILNELENKFNKINDSINNYFLSINEKIGKKEKIIINKEDDELRKKEIDIDNLNKPTLVYLTLLQNTNPLINIIRNRY